MGVLKQADPNLAKFHLSPNRQGKPERRKVSDEFSSKKKFFEQISEIQAPVKAFHEPSVFSTKKVKAESQDVHVNKDQRHRHRDDRIPRQDLSKPEQLLAQMASKQARLADLQEQQRLLEFEILEIQAQLHESFPEKPLKRMENSSPRPNFSELKKTTSTFFDHSSNELRKTVSTLFQNKSPARPDLRHQASAFFAKNLRPNPELKTKASMMLNTTLTEVKEKLDQQQSELETITRKGTDFAREIFTSLSPKKPNPADSSFMVENLCGGRDSSLLRDASILLSEDESFNDGHAILASFEAESFSNHPENLSGSSIIDIDDYESSDDER